LLFVVEVQVNMAVLHCLNSSVVATEQAQATVAEPQSLSIALLTALGVLLAGPSNATTAPDFIRIAGATKQRPKRPAIDQQKQPLLQQQNRAAGAVSTAEGAAQDRRKQLKAVLRQLLTDGAVESLPDGLAGLVEGLKGLQSSSAHLQAQDSKAGAQAQAASLVALLRQQQQQQQQQTGLTQLSKAQQLVLQRRKAQEEERQRQQEQGEQQEDASKPGWQSEVYVPPPSRMLRVKKGGVADVWNAPDSSEPGVQGQGTGN
jgi:hypothetical protein